jgi:hypothetical protein
MLTDSQVARLNAENLMLEANQINEFDGKREMGQKYGKYSSVQIWLCRISQEEFTEEDQRNLNFCTREMRRLV